MLPFLTAVLLTTTLTSVENVITFDFEYRIWLKGLVHSIQDFGCCTQAADGCQDRAV